MPWTRLGFQALLGLVLRVQGLGFRVSGAGSKVFCQDVGVRLRSSGCCWHGI